MSRPRGLPAVQRRKEVHLSVQRPLCPSLDLLERIPDADPMMRQYLNFIRDDWELQEESRKMVEGAIGRVWTPTFTRPPSFSSVVFGVGALGGVLGISGSAAFEPMGQIPTYRLTTFNINIPAKSFALCFTFMFRFVKVFATSGRRTNRTPATQRIFVFSLLDRRGCLCLGRKWCCARISCAGD